MIAVVAQDTYLFHGTIEDNLRLGCPDASEAELVAAARAANAHDFIEALPDGYQTVIGERGARLSGGQRQRIAIARALLRDAPILVLDEALSSVDAENEAVIQQALDRLMTGRTTLILAHRLSSVINADRILVLQDGAVADSGRHAELIARDGPYRRLMGPQLAERSDAVAPLDDLPATATAPTEDTSAVVRDLAQDAAEVGWPETIRTLLGFIRPWRRQLAITVSCGIGRVVAFIGVGIFGALIIAAVQGERTVAAAGRSAARRGAGRGAAALARIVPGARHGIPAAGRDARRSIPQARCTGARLPAEAPLRRPGCPGDAGCRDDRVLLRSHSGAGLHRSADPGCGTGDARRRRLAIGVGAAALPGICRRLADTGPAAHRPPCLHSARRAWASSAHTRRRPFKASPN